MVLEGECIGTPGTACACSVYGCACFHREPAVKSEELKPLSTDEALAKDSHQPAAGLEDAGNETPDMSTDTDDLPEMDMDRPLPVTLGKDRPWWS